MKVTRNLIIFLTILLLSREVSGKSPVELFTFIQLTDIQMGMISKNANNDAEIGLYTTAIQEVNRLKPAFVVITGDFVNNRTDTNQIIAFRKITALINKKIRVFFIPGNHDMGQIPDKEKMDFYFRYFPSDKFEFMCKRVQLTGINSCLINSGIEEELQQMDWLKTTLMKQSTKVRKIIFTHHPFFITDIHEKDSYSNIPLSKRMEYMQLFKNNGVKFIFAGHYHNNAQAQHGDIQMITTSAVGKPLGSAKSGFRVVTVYKDSISHKYVELPTQ